MNYIIILLVLSLIHTKTLLKYPRCGFLALAIKYRKNQRILNVVHAELLVANLLSSLSNWCFWIRTYILFCKCDESIYKESSISPVISQYNTITSVVCLQEVRNGEYIFIFKNFYVLSGLNYGWIGGKFCSILFIICCSLSRKILEVTFLI